VNEENLNEWLRFLRTTPIVLDLPGFDFVCWLEVE
jgi:hypothetical protein